MTLGHVACIPAVLRLQQFRLHFLCVWFEPANISNIDILRSCASYEGQKPIGLSFLLLIYPQKKFSHILVQEELFLERIDEFFSLAQIVLTPPDVLSVHIVYSYSMSL